MMLVGDIVSWALILGGGFFLVVGAVGVLRLPDFFSRQHAAGVTDTMGAYLLLAGLMVQGGLTLVSAKLVLIVVFLFVTGPTSTHALAQAAVSTGLKPFLGERQEDGSSKT